MIRPALYARYSSENQSETSIEDQVRVGTAFATRHGWRMPTIFSDREISAAVPTLRRPGGRDLLNALRAGNHDVLIIEALDRCWRDIVDQERTIREIERLGVRIVGVNDGYDTEREGRELQRIIIGGVNQQYLRELAKKTHRGLAGQFARGFFAGGLPYGYRSIEVEGGHHLGIDADQAPWVLWIFEQYAAGASSRAIAYELNRRRIPSPRGGTWALSAISGHAKYQTGILRNPLYLGKYTWNKSQWLKDPDTGIRKRIERPPAEWQSRDMPELRIIPDDLWQAAEARQRGPYKRGKGRPARSPFSGLLRCGQCGGPLILVDPRGYGCGRHKDRGPAECPGVRVPRQAIEDGILSGLRAELLSEEAVSALRKEVARLLAEKTKAATQGAAGAAKRLAELDREIANLVDAVAAVGFSHALRERLATAEAERDALRAEISNNEAEAPQAAMIPRLIERYRAAVADLPAILSQRPAAARDTLRELLGEVVITREESGQIWAEMNSQEAVLLNVVAGGRFRIKKRQKLRVDDPLDCTKLTSKLSY